MKGRGRAHRDERERLRRLERGNRELRRADEILKSAVDYFGGGNTSSWNLAPMKMASPWKVTCLNPLQVWNVTPQKLVSSRKIAPSKPIPPWKVACSNCAAFSTGHSS
jgi:hypothetical protein